MSNPFRRTMAGVALTGLAGAATITGISPAHSVPDPVDAQCPEAFPVADLVKDQPVDGLTVSSGTVPDTFTGQVLGVLKDGIAPGLDMIIVRLSSSEIDRVGGIWQGMSGSPVYASDGRLIGAVSYGLAYGSSPVAGVTPAADMLGLLGDTSDAAVPAKSRSVALRRSMQRSLVASGAASAKEASSGLERLPLPVAISGVFNTKRMNKLSKRLTNHYGFDNVRLYRSGSAATAAEAGPSSDIFAGSNLAASLSYGDFSAVGTGTTTAVCGDQVVGFGHPFNFTGDSSMTLHGADAIYVQEDPLGAPFKVSNATAPVGTINQDTMEGIAGVLGVLPATTLVHAEATFGSKSRTGDTYVSMPDFLADATAYAIFGNQDRVFDRIGKGSALVHYTIDGTADGEPFTVVRTNRYADGYDVSGASGFEAADDVYQLLGNDFSDVTIDAIRSQTALSSEDREFTIGSVQAKVGGQGTYKTLKDTSVVKANPGQTIFFKVTLKSLKNKFGSEVVSVSTKVPTTASPGTFASLSVGSAAYISGGGGEDEGLGSDSAGAPSSFADLVDQLNNAPRNDQLTAELDLFSDSGATTTSARSVQLSDVLNDARSWEFRVKGKGGSSGCGRVAARPISGRGC